MQKIFQKTSLLSAIAALGMAGGGLTSPARADWVIVDRSQITPPVYVTCSVPELSASVSGGAPPGTMVNPPPISDPKTASVTCKWLIPALAVTPGASGTFYVNHNMTLLGTAPDTSLGSVAGITQGPPATNATAQTQLDAGGGGYGGGSDTTTCTLTDPSYHTSLPFIPGATGIKTYSWTNADTNGPATKLLTAIFNVTLTNSASVWTPCVSFKGEPPHYLRSANATAHAATAKTQSFSISGQ